LNKRDRNAVFMNNDEELGLVYTYSGLTFYRERKVKRTRVEHTCFYCQKVLLKGSSTTYISGKDPQMGFYHYHLCKDCHP
jgi:hypothetical protein